ncbi:hypothetical protein V8E54_010466 [Elaphomyces granulatus]
MSASPLSPSSSTEAPCRSARTTSPEALVTPSPPPKGHHAFAAFKNNLLNVNPTASMWPVQVLLWIVGYLEGHTLDSAVQSFNAWTVNLRLSPEYNRSLDALLKTGTFKSYAPPNRYSLLKAKATCQQPPRFHIEYVRRILYCGRTIAGARHLRRVNVHRITGFTARPKPHPEYRLGRHS